MKQQISVKTSTAILVLLFFCLLTLVSPAGAQTITTTVEGTVSIQGPVILPPATRSVPLRRARVTVYRVEVGATGITLALPVAFGFTGDNGGYSLSIETEEDPEFDVDVAVGITLVDEDDLLSAHDQERDPTDPASMISRSFEVKAGATIPADLLLNINSTSNATEYSVQGLSFQPVQGDVYDANQGMSQVGGDRFAHLAVMYARVLTAALFVKDVLGEALPSVRVQGWDPGTDLMSYGPFPIQPYMSLEPPVGLSIRSQRPPPSTCGMRMPTT